MNGDELAMGPEYDWLAAMETAPMEATIAATPGEASAELDRRSTPGSSSASWSGRATSAAMDASRR